MNKEKYSFCKLNNEEVMRASDINNQSINQYLTIIDVFNHQYYIENSAKVVKQDDKSYIITADIQYPNFKKTEAFGIIIALN